MRSPPHIVTLILLTAAATVSLNMFLPSLVNIARDFEADYAVVSLAVGGYLAVTAVLQVVIGPVSDRYGRRPVILAALVVFALASVGCLLAQSVWAFLAWRMVQGAVIAGAALSSAVVRDMMPPKQAAGRLGYIAMAMAVAPMLGPMLGGFLDVAFGWRASFAVFAAMGLGLLLLCWIDLGETHHRRATSLGAQFATYPALIRAPMFWGYALCKTFSTGAFYAFLAGVPLVARDAFGMQPGELGLYIGSITGGFFMGSFIAARMAPHAALATTMLTGRMVACGGLTVGLILYAAGFQHELALFGPTLCVGIGNGITMPGASSGAMSVRPDLAGSAAGLAGAMTVAGGAVLTTLSGAVVPATGGVPVLLWLMLAASALGLAAAVCVARAEARGPQLT
ncbi:MAG: Bcr/CflA family efflux MFS transporter [Rhodobacteraceae bacterium]|nr:Bcr/CflA family efflux MFS transporter [Paracoccaceae bacterium]